jgi:predicted neuraminidase
MLPDTTTRRVWLPALYRLLAGLAGCVILLALDSAVRLPAPAPAAAAMVQHTKRSPEMTLFLTGQGTLPVPEDAPSAHASNLTRMADGHTWQLLALWFAGSREAAPDVRIAASFLDRASGSWSAARYVLDRHGLAALAGFGFSRLGNPVGWLDTQGRLNVLVVATGLGGWAAARIVHVRLADPVDLSREPRWEYLGVLPLSWFWNTSFLVRNPPLPLQDGGMVLPVHFELSRSYPVALRFDADGRLLDVVRMSQRTDIMQPSIVAIAPDHWLAYLRNTSSERLVAVSETTDAGRSWSDQPSLGLHNPDSAVVALALASDHLVMAHNHQPDGRNTLHLSASFDGRVWRPVETPAQGDAHAEYSYPALVWSDGGLWLSYTDRRRQIAWQRYEINTHKPPKTDTP